MNFNKCGPIAIIGCGLIGRKRIEAIKNIVKVDGCFDVNQDISKSFANEYKIKSFKSIDELISENEIKTAIVATRHDSLACLTLKLLESGINVFVEKPAAKNYKELESVRDFLKKSTLKVHVGFNHRYHKTFLKAKEIVDSNEIGELMFIRGRYGHGGRIGYENEWRADKKISGGGELIDQGPHLIDLSKMFLGSFKSIEGFADTFFWKMDVDDNAFMLLRNEYGQTASLHVSCTEWKNMFSFEIYGKIGKIEISGLGGSYGVEKITLYKMLKEMGPPETTTWEYPFPDSSWETELIDFFNCIENDLPSNSDIENAYEVLNIVDKIYKSQGK